MGSVSKLVNSITNNMGSKPMNWMEDRISGGSSTSGTAFSKLADPFRQMRQHQAAGGGTSPEDMADPLGHAHHIDSPTEIRTNAMLEATRPQREADAAANAATDAANKTLIAAKRRRQSTATGAVAGGAQLSSTVAYGMSKLGGD